MKQVLILLLVITSVACRQAEEHTNTVTYVLSEKQLPSLRNQYLYLMNEDKQVVIDSQLVSDTKVELQYTLHPDSPAIFCSIRYVDSTNAYKRPIGFLNTKTPNAVFSFFYVDQRPTVFQPNSPTDEYASWVSGSKVNDADFSMAQLYYSKDAIKQVALLKKNIQTIQSYPNSIGLLKQLFYIKGDFNSAEATTMLEAFNHTVQKHPIGERIRQYYLTGKPDDTLR